MHEFPHKIIRRTYTSTNKNYFLYDDDDVDDDEIHIYGDSKLHDRMTQVDGMHSSAIQILHFSLKCPK